MDEIVKEIRKGKGYKMTDQEIKIFCIADDTVLFANKVDLQRNLHLFHKMEKNIMMISVQKTKCVTT